MALICIRRNPNLNPNLDHEPSGGSHSHTAVGLRSFCIVAIILIQRSGYAHFTLSLSFSYSGRATFISHCRVALIVIQRYSGRAAHILHCRIALIDIQRSGYAHFAFVVSLSFPLNVWLLLSLSRVAGCIPRAVRGSRCRTS